MQASIHPVILSSPVHTFYPLTPRTLSLQSVTLHLMYTILSTPAPHFLSPLQEQQTRRTEQERQAHVRHDRWQEPGLLDPRADELGETVAPEVLVDGDGDEDGTGDGFVAVDGVGADDGGDGSDLDSGAGEADDDDGFPGPFVLVAEGHDEIAEEHDEDVGEEGGETHLRFTDAAVAFGGAHRDPVG